MGAESLKPCTTSLVDGEPAFDSQAAVEHKSEQGAKRKINADGSEAGDCNSRSAKRGKAQQDAHAESTDVLQHWVRYSQWPPGLFEEHAMYPFLARPKSFFSLKRSNSASSSETASDQRPREAKSAPYRHVAYERALEKLGVFLKPCPAVPASKNKELYDKLLEPRTDAPAGSLFDQDIFAATICDLHGRNEARVIQDIARLLVPSAETLARRGHISIPVIENVNEGWNCAIPLKGPRPQPDYSVGFKSAAFSEGQVQKLDPLLGTENDKSWFMATFQTLFPFLSSEVKCGAEALDVADRQNAHSATLAVRSCVKLFCAVGRAEELNGKVLAFSISHSDRYVRLHGHYALTTGEKTTFYRDTIREFCFSDRDGGEKWTSHHFVRNVYEHWLPEHHKLLCSAIDRLPDPAEYSSHAPSQSGQSLPPTPQSSALSRMQLADAVEPPAPASRESGTKRPRTELPACEDET